MRGCGDYFKYRLIYYIIQTMKSSIDFLITQKCNYRCEYCSQSKQLTEGRQEEADDATVNAFLKFLETLPRVFEITISGGEPLCHKKFFYFVEEIVRLGFKISVVSNFSFPIETYKKLKDVAGDNLSELFVSLHLSQIKSPDEFLNKAEEFNLYKGKTVFTVASVLSDENCDTLKKVAAFTKEKNINFELQHMRIKNSFVEYTKEASDFIKGFPISKIKEASGTFGKICHAGINFLFIYQNGEVYRCYSSRFNRIHSMGNIKDKNFKIYKTPIPCLNKNCTCPKPIIKGMIDYKKKAPFKAALLGAYNILWIPYYAVKNFEIIKTKFAQAKKFKK